MNKEIVLNIDGSHNGHNYVDLGLPSGTKWATCNVGANNPEDEGLLFQFGRTDGYAYNNTYNTFTTREENRELTGYYYINPTTSGTYYDAGQTLSLNDDIACANMGGKWIMPTKYDLQELYDNTTRQVMTINGKNGMLFTSNINSKSIFVVFAGYWDYDNGQFNYSGSCGYLWSSEVNSSDAGTAWYLGFDSDSDCHINYYRRAIGHSARGILK